MQNGRFRFNHGIGYTSIMLDRYTKDVPYSSECVDQVARSDITDSTISNATIAFLFSVFARFGHPLELVSDNGPQFSSDEFSQYMTMSGIRHHMGAPYHPQAIGLVELTVQSVKNAFLKIEEQPGSLKPNCFGFC